MDYFLKFESEEQANSVLFTAIPAEKNPAGEEITPPRLIPKFQNIDVIGDIFKPTGETEKKKMPNGDEFDSPVFKKLDGWHVNVRVISGEDASEFFKYAVNPANPTRVWG